MCCLVLALVPLVSAHTNAHTLTMIPSHLRTQIAKQIGDEWGRLTDAQKKPYADRAAEAKNKVWRTPVVTRST